MEQLDDNGAGAQDALLVDGVCGYEAYLDEHKIACDKLKMGFLKLTMARRHLPAHTVSELSYKELFEASYGVLDDDTALRVTTRVASKPNGAHEPEEVMMSSSPKQSNGLSQRHNRGDSPKKTAANPSSASSPPSSPGKKAQNDTILWFSSLPPNDLRQAQQQFHSALQAFVEAAVAARTVQRSIRQLGPLPGKQPSGA